MKGLSRIGEEGSEERILSATDNESSSASTLSSMPSSVLQPLPHIDTHTMHHAVVLPQSGVVSSSSSRSSGHSTAATNNTSLSELTQMRIPSIAELMSQKKVLDLIPGLAPTSSQMPPHLMASGATYPMAGLAASMGLTHNFPLHLHPHLHNIPTLSNQLLLSHHSNGGGMNKAFPMKGRNRSGMRRKVKARTSSAMSAVDAVNASFAKTASQILASNKALTSQKLAAVHGSTDANKEKTEASSSSSFTTNSSQVFKEKTSLKENQNILIPPVEGDDNASTTSAASSATIQSKESSLSFSPNNNKDSVMASSSSANTTTSIASAASSSAAAVGSVMPKTPTATNATAPTHKVIVSKYMNYSLLAATQQQQQVSKPSKITTATHVPMSSSAGNSPTAVTGTTNPVKVPMMMSGPANAATWQSFKSTPMASSLKYPISSSSPVSSSAVKDTSSMMSGTKRTVETAVMTISVSPLPPSSCASNLISSFPPVSSIQIPAVQVSPASKDFAVDNGTTIVNKESSAGQMIERKSEVENDMLLDEDNELMDMSVCFPFEDDEADHQDIQDVSFEAKQTCSVQAMQAPAQLSSQPPVEISPSVSSKKIEENLVMEDVEGVGFRPAKRPSDGHEDQTNHKKVKKSKQTKATSKPVPITIESENTGNVGEHMLDEQARVLSRMTYFRPSFQHFLNLLPHPNKANNGSVDEQVPNWTDSERLCRHFMITFFQTLTRKLYLLVHQYYQQHLQSYVFYNTPAIFAHGSSNSSSSPQNKRKQSRSVSVASEGEAHVSNAEEAQSPGSPPCQEIAIYYALKATIEFYQKYHSRLLEMCQATVTHSTYIPHVTINISTGELHPFISKSYLDCLHKACTDDLEDFTFSRKFIGYLSHLLPPTITQQASCNKEEDEEDDEDVEYKRCFDQVLQHLRQLVPPSPAIDYTPQITHNHTLQPTQSSPIAAFPKVSMLTPSVASLQRQSEQLPQLSSSVAQHPPLPAAPQATPTKAADTTTFISSEDALSIREVASFYFQDDNDEDDAAYHQQDELEDEDEESDRSLEAYHNTESNNVEEIFDAASFDFDVFQALASFS